MIALSEWLWATMHLKVGYRKCMKFVVLLQTAITTPGSQV